MSEQIPIICDRCKREIPGARYYQPEGGKPSFTAGYYMANGYPWNQYVRNEDELNICDDCMWSDPRYIADYGDNRPKPAQDTRS